MKDQTTEKVNHEPATIRSINPYTGEVMKEFALLGKKETEAEIARSRRALLPWKTLPLAQRAVLIRKLGDVLRAEKRTYGELITREMGKPIKDAVAEVEKCALLTDYYADNAPRFLAAEEIRTEAAKSYVTFEPLGILLAIMPWNFPFWQVFRCAVPAIAAGNVVALKHASNVPMCALAIEDAFRRAGFPENVLKTFLLDSQAALRLIDDDQVDAVSLTGSKHAGEEVAARAGARIRKVVLELGGSDPFIVLDDADLEKAGRMAAKARTINAGQSCIAAKRFIVLESVAEEFKKYFLAQLRELKVGDPMDETTDIGPLARADILATLRDQLQDARSRGAEILEMGPPVHQGLFFTPCAVYNPRSDMKILSEEVFGPIAPIIVVRDEDEAVQAANATEYGLGASLWSRNHDRAERLAGRIEAGVVVINDMVKSDPRLPFGGVKKSGIGRELSHYGLKEFVNIKSIVIRE